MKRIALVFLVAFLAAWFVPVSDAAARYLSLSCFLVAACIAGWMLYDWQRLRHGLHEDAELDHWPIRGSRDMPEWMRRNQINHRKP